jgi:hypothetical protein
MQNSDDNTRFDGGPRAARHYYLTVIPTRNPLSTAVSPPQHTFSLVTRYRVGRSSSSSSSLCATCTHTCAPLVVIASENVCHRIAVGVRLPSTVHRIACGSSRSTSAREPFLPVTPAGSPTRHGRQPTTVDRGRGNPVRRWRGDPIGRRLRWRRTVPVRVAPEQLPVFVVRVRRDRFPETSDPRFSVPSRSRPVRSKRCPSRYRDRCCLQATPSTCYRCCFDRITGSRELGSQTRSLRAGGSCF